MTGNDIMCNVASTFRELEFKRYSKFWWRDPLFKAAGSSGRLSGAHLAQLLRGYTHPR